MKRMRSVLAVVLAVLLTACEPAASLHSFWSEEYSEKEPKIEGTWEVYEHGRLEGTWTFEPAPDGSYTLTLRDADWESGDTVYHVRLVRLDGQLYFDAIPKARGATEKYIYLLPVHTVYKLWVDENTLQFAWLDDERLKSLLREGQAEIQHEVVDSTVILTASTEELQRLVRAHHAELFSEPSADEVLYRRENRAYLNRLEMQRALEPHNAQPLAEHGEMLMQQGRFGEARDSFEQAIGLEPSNGRYHDRLGCALLLLGLPDRARREFQDATHLGWNARYETGITYFLEQRYAEAVQEFEAGEPRIYRGEELVWQALALEKVGRSTEAQQLAQAFLEKPYLGQNSELVEFYLGRLTDDKFLTRASSPQRQSEAAFYAGLVYFVRGDTHRAHQLFRKATDAGVFDTLEYAAAQALVP